MKTLKFKTILLLLSLIPFTANADLLGLDSTIEGDYNIETNKSTLTGEIGKTVGMYGLSVTGDIDFDIIEFAYSGMDFKSTYSVGKLDLYVKSGLGTNWEMEDIIVGFTAKF